MPWRLAPRPCCLLLAVLLLAVAVCGRLPLRAWDPLQAPVLVTGNALAPGSPLPCYRYHSRLLLYCDAALHCVLKEIPDDDTRFVSLVRPCSLRLLWFACGQNPVIMNTEARASFWRVLVRSLGILLE